MLKKTTAVLLLICVMMTQIGFTNPQPFDALVPKLTPLDVDASEANTLKGSAKGKELVIGANFLDGAKIYGDDDIAKLAALGVINTFGSRKYRPSDKATGYEALTQLLFMKGQEAAIMTAVYAQAGSSTTPAALQKVLKQEVLAQAQAQGILTNDEVLGLNDPVMRERLAVWTARAIGKQPSYTQRTTFSFTDWASVNPTYRGLIEDLITDGIMPLKNTGAFGPKESVSRAELAVIVSAATETQYGARGIQTAFGLIVSDRTDVDKAPGNTTETRTLTVKNADGTMTKLVSETQTKGSKRFDYVVHKGGVTSSNKLLAVGDEIEYLTQDGALVFAEVMPDHLILEKINASAESDAYNRFQFGKVADIRTNTEVVAGKSVITEIYRIVDVSGDVFDIEVTEDTYTGQRDDILTYKNGKVRGANVLKVDDMIQYLVTDKRQVVYIKVTDLTPQNIAGTVREVAKATAEAPAKVTIFGYDDKVYTLPLAPYAGLTINDRLATIEDFVYGMPVTVELTGSSVITMSGTSYDTEPGYIPKYGKMRIGEVTSVYKKSFTITLNGGIKEFYEVTPQTVFVKDGNVVSIEALKAGTPVKVYFDDIASNQVSRVEIESPEVLFETIYKGQLQTINNIKGEIGLTGVDGLSKPEYISNNDWEQADAFNVSLKVNTETDIYVGNEKLDMKELDRSYSGYPVYAVVKSVFGKPTVVKMSVMTGGETMHQSNIRKLDNTIGTFELSTRENFNITDGTIIIRDGLVVPNNSLNIRDTVFVVSESPRGTYEKNAMVVKVITPFDDIFNGIRIGAIEDVNPSNFTLRNHTQYFNNFLNDVNKNASGYYRFYTGSLIQDITDRENILTIKPRDFFHKDYARLENPDKNYQSNQKGLPYDRYYAFMVVNPADNSIIAMKMRQKGLVSGQNIDDNLYKEEDIAKELEKTFDNAVLTRGIVTDLDETWDRVKLTDSHDWTDYTGRWTANRADIYVRYTDAIIIKNNQVKTVDDIKQGDYLYIMRIKDQGLVIFID